MVHIKVTKGLDIPIAGAPSGSIQPLVLGGEAVQNKKPKTLSLNLDPFAGTRFKLLAKRGDRVKMGQPLVEDKSTEGRVFTSPAGGTVAEVRRGLKRRLLDIIIDVDTEEEVMDHGSLDVAGATREQISDLFLRGGIFSRIRQRPFNLLANPTKAPRNIFVKAVESAPFVPPAEMQVQGKEQEFQIGLDALAKLTDGNVHLIYRQGTDSSVLTHTKNVVKHTGEGPHPLGTHSLHIDKIDPVRGIEDSVWTLTAYDVVAIGHLFKTGNVLTERVISIAGPGVIADRGGYFRVREGMPIESLISNRIRPGYMRLISGNPLTGKKVDAEDYLGFYHDVFCVIPENTKRELLHFFRLGLNKYSYSKAYYSGHIAPGSKKYAFTTNQHGEHRAFIDPTLYDRIMELDVPTMPLVKAVMAEDYDLAEELGFLAVIGEDFALPSFVCPSKMDMPSIVDDGLKAYAVEVLE